MEAVKVRYSLISLISYLIILIFGLWFISLEADDNTINIQTKGSDTNIGIDQNLDQVIQQQYGVDYLMVLIQLIIVLMQQ